MADTTVRELHIVHHQKGYRVPCKLIYPCVEPRGHGIQRTDVESSIPCSSILDRSFLGKFVKSLKKRIVKILLFYDLLSVFKTNSRVQKASVHYVNFRTIGG